jgi:hypothetical protein
MMPTSSQISDCARKPAMYCPRLAYTSANPFSGMIPSRRAPHHDA